MNERHRLEVRVGAVLSPAQGPGWRYEALLPRMAGADRWELSLPMKSWTEAKEEAESLERLGYRVRVVFVDHEGVVYR